MGMAGNDAFAGAAFTLAALSFSIAFAAQSDDEAAIKTIVQSMQEGWNKKDGAGFAAGFAPQHDYVNILGLYLPNARKGGNARAHQQLFDTVYKDTGLQLHVAKLKFLTPDIAPVHMLGHTQVGPSIVAYENLAPQN